MSTRRERAKEPSAKLNKQLAELEDRRKLEFFERNIYLWKSEMATDLAKLIFAGVVIGGIYQQQIDFKSLWQTGGFAMFIVSLVVGYYYYKRGIKS
jgi:hypothetical protein